MAISIISNTVESSKNNSPSKEAVVSNKYYIYGKQIKRFTYEDKDYKYADGLMYYRRSNFSYRK